MKDLRRLLAPRSIAVVGGGAWCANVLRQCRKIGFDGAVWPVHPTRETFEGYPVIATLEALPEAPDASFIGVNRAATLDVVESLRARGAGGAVCFASGFAEAEAEMADGRALQARLLEAAGDMTILGPNCYGLLNMLDGVALWPDHHGCQPVESGVAIVAQSSNVAINMTMQRRGLPLAYVVTVGNAAQTDMAEIGIALLQDTRVTVLGLYLEGVGDLDRFQALAAEAKRLGKHIVALKVGASEQSQRAAVSHTASLAGSATGARALFERLGIGQVDGIGAFLETLKLLHVIGPLPSHRIASMSCSGGEASLVADSAMGTGLEFPALSEGQTKALSAALGPKVALANPLDYHTYIWADVDAMAETFAAMMQGDLALGIVVLDFPRADRCVAEEWPLVIEAVVRAREASGKPMAIMSSYPDTMPEDMALDMMARGIVPLSGVGDGLAAVEVAALLGRESPKKAPLLLPGTLGEAVTLSEADAKAALAGCGVPVPRSLRAGSVEAAAAAAETLGFPVVLKGEGIAHKTEAGAVFLGLTSGGEVAAAAQAMGVETFLVEDMVTGGIGELLVGVTLDPAHGFLLTLGAGGVLAEVMRDSTSLLMPVTAEDVLKALNKLAYAPVLNGFRGAPAGDAGAIAAAVLAVQDYVMTHRATVQEVEINPLIVRSDGAVAADALIRVKEKI